MVANAALSWSACGLAGAALGVSLVALLRESALPAPHDAPAVTAAADGDDTSLRREVTALKQRLALLESAAPRQEVFDQTRIEELIAKALVGSSRGAALPATASVPAGSPAAAAATARLVQELAQAPPGAQRDALWQRLRELGGVDAAVAHFERVAASLPQSADAQTDLGTALIQKMLQTQDEAQRVEIGKKIEGQFDQALALQPDHWEARFRKAVGLTYGPALSGRQDEAITHFETLMTQQAQRPASAQFAQTYLYLGRLYAQRGDVQKAQEVWQQGLARHPQDAELQQTMRR